MDIKKIVELHGKLEGRIKQFETTLDIYLPTEVSNELRYVLRAVMEVIEIEKLNDYQQSDLDYALQRAYHALICAYHDLVDGLAIHITLTLDRLRLEYLEESIVVLGSKRQEIIEFLNEVNDKIAYSRENAKERRGIYEEDLYENYFSTLLEYKKFLSGRLIEDVVNLSLQKEQDKKIENRKYMAGFSISLIALSVAIYKIYQ